MSDYRQSPNFWLFTVHWFGSVKFVSPSKLSKRIQWDSFSHLSCHCPCHLPTTSRLSRVGWFSRAVAFRSLYNPWGKIRTTRSLASQRQGTIYSSLTIARKYKIFHSFLEHGLFFFGSLHLVVRGQLYAGSRRLCSSLPAGCFGEGRRDRKRKAMHGRSLATKIG